MPLPVAVTPDEQYLALEHVVSVMLSRRNSLAMPRIVVYIDEMADTALAGGKAALELLSRIAARGRSAGIHILGCTQNPSAKSLPEDLRRNLPLRFVGKVSNATEARMAAGMGDTGAELLAGRGAFIACVNGEAIRLQAALPDLDITDPCPIPDWPTHRGHVYDEVIQLPAHRPAQIAPPTPPPSPDNAITPQVVIATMSALANAGTPINKTNVLVAMNRPAAGGSWRKICEIWDECLAAFRRLPTQSTHLPTYLPT
jgi:hypothetical protein